MHRARALRNLFTNNSHRRSGGRRAVSDVAVGSRLGAPVQPSPFPAPARLVGFTSFRWAGPLIQPGAKPGQRAVSAMKPTQF